MRRYRQPCGSGENAYAAMPRRACAPRGLPLLALLFLLGVTGCTDTPPPPTHIGIVLYGDSRTPQVDGFIDGLKQLGYAEPESVRFTILNAHNSRKALPDLVRKLLDLDVDMIASTGGLETDAIKQVVTRHPKSVPVVVLYVNAIIERGVVKTRRDPGWNVTGIDNLNAELSGKRIELLHELLPQAKRVLILYTERIDPSRLGVTEARALATKLGITIVARNVTTRTDIAAVMRALRPGEVDAMLLVPNAPIENTLDEIIYPQARRLRLPIIATSRSMAEAGALAAYGASFYDMGAQAARLAVKVLQGVPPRNIPFETPKRFQFTVNVTTQELLNLRLTDAASSAVDEYVGRAH